IEIAENELTDLTALAGHPDGIYLSPGVLDETVRIFALCRTATREQLAALSGRCTGLPEEGEQITLQIVELEGLQSIPDAKTLVAYSLYQRFQERIPQSPLNS